MGSISHPTHALTPHTISPTLSLAETLPDELLLPILFQFCRFYAYSGRANMDQEKYIRARGELAALRLVCPAWNPAINELLFSHVVVFTSPLNRPKDIKHIVLDDDDSPHGGAIDKEAVKLLGQALARCHKIQTFEIHGNSKLLVGFGPVLESLEIHNWKSHSSSVFHLPATLPQLSRLLIQDGAPPLLKLQKLFSRMIIRGSDAEAKCPLQNLKFSRAAGLYGDIISTILLSKNLGHHLTSLHIEVRKSDVILNLDDSGIRVIKACPSLTHFAYIAPTTSNLLDYISPTVQDLELLVPFKKNVGQPSSPSLTEILVPFLQKHAVDEFHVPLKKACEEYNVTLNTQHYILQW
ncbi:hypothetical protein BDQ12DRAFT_708634 [Crucibulum laeve]|uniref:F-box domain-containing protein n=1 Tax=Crucibulum laeve TaxID=68775 RepID=A0A5C3MHB1_9AGAR|nr:hypothetical protein BDQ12DRAFT_708634 [Crucibulum laeve]